MAAFPSKLQLLGLLAALPLSQAETVLGAFIFHRHGDRTAKSWAPANLTALGADEVFQSGTYWRNRYIAANATTPFPGLSPDIAVAGQLAVTAPVDTVLQNSAGVFVQALYPPAGASSAQRLRNGSSVEAPLGGYQYLPVNTIDSSSAAGTESTEWLQGGSGCGNAIVSSNSYFSSQSYLETLNSTHDFYRSLLPVYNGTFSSSTATFQNAYTIYDLVNVAEIHNTTIPYSDLITPEVFFQLQTRSDQHEWGLAYNESDTARAIAGAVLAAQIVQQLNTTLSSPPAAGSSSKLGVQFGTYASFMSFFGLAGLVPLGVDFTGICGYASSMTFELVTNSSAAASQAEPIDPADVSVRFMFANNSASAANEPVVYPLFGQDQTTLPWVDFVAGMNKFAVGNTAAWCQACGNTTGVCAAAASTSGSSSGSSAGGSGSGGVSRPTAGVIGALVTLVVILGLQALVMAIAGLRVVKKGATKASNEGSAQRPPTRGGESGEHEMEKGKGL